MKKVFILLFSILLLFAFMIPVLAGTDFKGTAKETFVDMTSHMGKAVPINAVNNAEMKDKSDEELLKETLDNQANDEQGSNAANDSTGVTLENKSNDSDSDESNSIEEANEDEQTDDGNTDTTSENNTDITLENTKETEIEISEVPEKAYYKVSLSSSEVDDNLLLVNKDNPLENKFIPQDLALVLSKGEKIKIPTKKTDTLLKREALTALECMYAGAVKQGIYDMVLSSGYRSYNEQNVLFNKKVNIFSFLFSKATAADKAAAVVAPPGKSEHQTGLSVDLTTKLLMKKSDPLVEEFAGTDCGKWMAGNSWRFGYILRYQANKTNLTGIVNEPWHYRYVGNLHAEIMMKDGFCLEEYIQFIKNKKYISFTDASGIEYEMAYVLTVTGSDSLNILAYKGSTIKVSRINKYEYVVCVRH